MRAPFLEMAGLVGLVFFASAASAQKIPAAAPDLDRKVVPSLPGPFDFVFCDADKDWYKNYLVAVLPKLTVGGAFAAHNVSPRMRGGRWGAAGFVDHVLSLPFLETSFAEESGAGLSISIKRAEKQGPASPAKAGAIRA